MIRECVIARVMLKRRPKRSERAGPEDVLGEREQQLENTSGKSVPGLFEEQQGEPF